MHPFWTHPRISITPHIAAFTIPDIAMDTIVENIQRIERAKHLWCCGYEKWLLNNIDIIYI